MKIYRLEDVVKSVSVTHKFKKKEVIFLNTSDVLDGKILTKEYMLVKDLKGQAKKTIRNGDILYSEIRPKNRRFAYVNVENEEDYVVSTKLMVLRNYSKDVLTDFFYYYITSQSVIDYLQRRAENRIGSFPQITFDILKSLRLDVPEPKVQQNIVKVISTLDAKIDLNNRINAELESLARTIYDYWFLQFDFPDGAGRPYRSSGGEMRFDEELGREVPLGWEVKSLYDVADYYNGLAMQKYRPKGDEKLRVIKIREMNNGFSESTEFARPSIPKEAIIQDGDVLFSWSATLDVKIWSEGTGALNQHIFKVTSKKYPKTFYYLELLRYLDHFKMLADRRKTTMGHITLGHLKESRIAVPPVQLCEKMDKLLNPFFAKSLALKQENRHLSSLRDWLLPLLMSGEVVVGE